MQTASMLPTQFQRFSIIALAALTASCAENEGGPPSSVSATPYCSYIASPQVFSSPVTVSGEALYQYRAMGNGSVSGDWITFRTQGSYSSTKTYSLTINSTTFTSTGKSTVALMLDELRAAIAANSSISSILTPTAGASVTDISGEPALKLTLVSSGSRPSYSGLTNLFPDGGHHNPIRRAEVMAVNSSGQVVQCTETNGSGQFSMSLPANSGTYTIKVNSRSSNSYNAAFVLNDPNENSAHSVSTSVGTSGNTSGLSLLAPATGTLVGGAFNILDQILIAQDYLRSETAGCNVVSSANYYPDCTPYTVAPLLTVYWKPGVSPGVYVGYDGPISFYLNGEKELYILGGVGGDTTTTDMDHFDNSVILHELAHFLEDQYGDPDSPGGSHSGNAVIDPRLAWGEGWANFFQAAVTGYPYYRDTYGHANCTGSVNCYGINFNEYLDPSGTPTNDNPTATGEGNFREFSVARLLWDVVKPSGVSRFAEIWTALSGVTNGMRAVNDPFKSIGRLHVIQQATSGASDWSSIRTTEKHAGDLSGYATPITTASGCSPSSVAMSIYKSPADDGSFSDSNQFRNNDFYAISHGGGNLNVSITWSGTGVADLDLYLYKTGYVFGSSSSIVMSDTAETSSTSGSAVMAGSAAAGIYMINVMAYTGVYGSSGTYNTNYTLSVNGQTACPAP